MPPALSDIGPYPSIAKAIAKFESIPRAARAIPYIPQREKETKIVTARPIVGMIQEE